MTPRKKKQSPCSGSIVAAPRGNTKGAEIHVSCGSHLVTSQPRNKLVLAFYNNGLVWWKQLLGKLMYSGSHKELKNHQYFP